MIQTLRNIFKKKWLLYGGIYMVFLVGHIYYYQKAPGFMIFPDSGTYYENSRLPLTDIWESPRPPVILLFYKLFGTYDYETWDWNWSGIVVDDALLMYSQIVFYIAAFSFLAFACAKTAQTSKGRLILFAFPLLFSLIPSVVKWNFLALSESFCFSLFVVFVALWILFLFFKRLAWLWGIAIVALLWSGVRDTNPYLLVMIASVILIIMVASVRLRYLNKGRERYGFNSLLFVFLTTLCIYFVGIFALSNYSANQGNRWLFSFYNIMGKRILPVPEHVSYFSDHGMPISQALLKLAGTWASDGDWPFYRDPHLEGFRAWTANHGKMTYIKFLMSHFIYSITAPISDSPRYLNVMYAHHFYEFVPTRSGQIPPWLSTALLYLLPLSYGLAVCLTPILWWRRWLHKFPYLAVPLVMILLSLPHAWLVWHGDAMETGRHSMTAVIQFLLGFVLLWLYIWDHSTRQRESATTLSPLPSPLSPKGVGRGLTTDN